MTTKNYAITLADGRTLSEDELSLAVARGLGLNPDDVGVAELQAPKVVLMVNGGQAEIAAVSGEIHLIHADLDREGDSLNREAIESILEGSTYRGTEQDYQKGVEAAQEGLERYLDTNFEP